MQSGHPRSRAERRESQGAGLAANKVDYLPNIAVVGGYANQTGASYVQQDIGYLGVTGSYTFVDWGNRRNTIRGSENLIALANLKVQTTEDEVRQKGSRRSERIKKATPRFRRPRKWCNFARRSSRRRPPPKP